MKHMTDTTEKLLPCAHCGAELPFMQNYQGLYQIQCRNCDIETRFQPKKYAIAAWNRRVAEKAKWTTETPTEEGWYWHKDAHNKPKMVYHKFGRVCFLTDSCVCGQSYEYWAEDIEEFGEHTQWLKIDIPALPEEGEAT